MYNIPLSSVGDLCVLVFSSCALTIQNTNNIAIRLIMCTNSFRRFYPRRQRQKERALDRVSLNEVTKNAGTLFRF